MHMKRCSVGKPAEPVSAFKKTVVNSMFERRLCSPIKELRNITRSLSANISRIGGTYYTQPHIRLDIIHLLWSDKIRTEEKTIILINFLNREERTYAPPNRIYRFPTKNGASSASYLPFSHSSLTASSPLSNFPHPPSLVPLVLCYHNTCKTTNTKRKTNHHKTC